MLGPGVAVLLGCMPNKGAGAVLVSAVLSDCTLGNLKCPGVLLAGALATLKGPGALKEGFELLEGLLEGLKRLGWMLGLLKGIGEAGGELVEVAHAGFDAAPADGCHILICFELFTAGQICLPSL